MRIALGIEYDGAGFSGWQTQPSGTGVQDVLEAALAEIAGHKVPTICAGRTDAGVHATAQVVHFDTQARRPDQAWVRGVNASLPAGVAVRWVRQVPEDFHARYSASARRYDYWLLNDPVRSPLACARMGWVFRPLDLEAMRAAAGALVGTHDFSSFRSAECQAKSPMRELRRLEIETAGRCFRLRFEANAFLHHMVRNMVGALVDVGLRRKPADWLEQLRDARDRTQASPTFSAAGLYLTAVHYDDRFALVEPDDGPRFHR